MDRPLYFCCQVRPIYLKMCIITINLDVYRILPITSFVLLSFVLLTVHMITLQFSLPFTVPPNNFLSSFSSVLLSDVIVFLILWLCRSSRRLQCLLLCLCRLKISLFLGGDALDSERCDWREEPQLSSRQEQ